MALARRLREWLPDYAWKAAGTTDSARRTFIGSGGDGHRIGLNLQKTFRSTRGREKAGGWSVSRECVPDLVLGGMLTELVSGRER